MQQSGNLVGFLNTVDPDRGFDPVLTEGAVFAPDGRLVATFPFEAGSSWRGYDPSGKYLVYTDAAGNVRWQGAGQAGLLSSGYVYSSW